MGNRSRAWLNEFRFELPRKFIRLMSPFVQVELKECPQQKIHLQSFLAEKRGVGSGYGTAITGETQLP
jgi:hypothetical protein